MSEYESVFRICVRILIHKINVSSKKIKKYIIQKYLALTYHEFLNTKTKNGVQQDTRTRKTLLD